MSPFELLLYVDRNGLESSFIKRFKIFTVTIFPTKEFKTPKVYFLPLPTVLLSNLANQQVCLYLRTFHVFH